MPIDRMSALTGPATLVETVQGKPRAAHAGRAPADDDPVLAAQLRKASRRFEALFYDILLEQMGKSGGGDLFFGDSSVAHVYRSMVDGALSEKLAEADGLGIADAVYRELAPAAGLSAPRVPLHRAAAAAYERASARALEAARLSGSESARERGWESDE